MTNYAHGHEADKVAVAFQKNQGHKLPELNGRYQRVELDIVARQMHRPLRIIEVKYGEDAAQDHGLDYITTARLCQMTFTAEL